MTKSNQRIPSEGEKFIAGDTADLNVTIETTSGQRKDLANQSVKFQLHDRPGGTVRIEKTTNDDITILNADEGEVVVHLSSSDTEGLGSPSGKNYYYTIELENQETKATVTTGFFEIHSD